MAAYVNHRNNTEIRDEYSTPRDRIWGNVIQHERVLELMWKETWKNSIVPSELRPEKPKPEIKRDISAFYHPNSSPSVPPKASAMIGWRSADPSYTVEFFNVKYVSSKKRFIKEQFGYYRELKYLQEAQGKKKEETPPTRNERFIKHIPKRLVC